ncbi:MAG: chromosomal replication initiator protein DnaA [Betaproteobacteria bacterium]|nr:chromosomal replication initiator protein DnaA [Betaproteobacteria bacterium]
MENFWQNCLNQMERELTQQQYNAWIKPLTPLGYEDGILRIAAPNRFKLDWAKKQFSDQLAALASQHWNEPVQVKFSLEVKSNKPALPLAPVASGTTAAVSITAGKPNPLLITETSQHEQSGINKEMTFDSFVTGKANQLARAAAIQVANNPGTSYNPLYLFGGVGLGKTHLIHAIGNQIMQDTPGTRIRYIHAEQYVRDVVTAYQRKGFDELKRYYHSLDVLLIDDIQFFVGKPRTQEEFFYAFEALIAAKKQIIITSETYPKEIAGLEVRLTSRFDSGLTVAIEPPELEMRVAILLKKAGTEGVQFSDDVAFFVAKHLRSNVRELEGALRKILAYSRFHGQDITIDLAKEALKDLLSVQSRQISVENIQKTVADFFHIKVADMYSKRRPANIARPRQIAMYLTKELTQKSLPEIGELFGGRDHTTVLHAVRKIAQDRAKNPECNRELHVLEQTLKG